MSVLNLKRLLLGLLCSLFISIAPVQAVTYYFHTDHLGTPQVLTDTNQAVVWQGNYHPFGEVTETVDAVEQNLRFPGQYLERESGLHYNYFRKYDPTNGRYTQSDPIELNGGINTYAYVGGNPISITDPLGLFGWADMPSSPQGVVDFSAGMGDVILFGQGQRLRNLLNIGGVDQCSGEYDAGEWAGVALSLASGAVGGLKAAGGKGVGKEFSHWIPDRMGGPRSILNGNYVSTRVHALSDPYRYRFMPRTWKAANPMPSRINQQWVRLPNVYKGAGAGGTYGLGGVAIND